MSRDYVLTRKPSHRLSDRLAALLPNDSTNGIRRELAGYQQNNSSREELNCGRPPSELPTASLEELRYGQPTSELPTASLEDYAMDGSRITTSNKQFFTS